MPLFLSFLCKSNKIAPVDDKIDVESHIQYLDLKYDEKHRSSSKKNKVVPMCVLRR